MSFLCFNLYLLGLKLNHPYLLAEVVIIWKSVSVFLLAVSSLTFSSNYINVERDKLNYEILNVSINNNTLVIDGWATMPSSQHFLSNTTHSYDLELNSDKELVNVPGTLIATDLTQQMSFSGNKTCNSSTINTDICNYNHKNVGFKFSIRLDQLNADQDYNVYLKMHAKQANKRYRIPVFYVTDGEKILKSERNQYIIKSDFSHAKFSIFAHTLIARDRPSPKGNYVYTKQSCSTSYKDIGYLRQNAVFQNIKDISLYDNRITYFKVRVQPNGCVNYRSRLVESNTSNLYAYVPSTHINYLGQAMTISVRALASKPNLFVEDVILNQYDRYDPYKYAQATDLYDGNISRKITIDSTNVNMNIPGLYQTCYSVTNTSNFTTQGCGRVEVIAIPTKKRFVSKYTIHDTYLKRWDRNKLKTKLHIQEFKLSEVIDK